MATPAEGDVYRAQLADARARTLNNIIAQLGIANRALYAAAPTIGHGAVIDAALLDLVGTFQVFVDVVNTTLKREERPKG